MISTGLPLFDTPIARRSDPATSHESARDTAPKLPLLQARFAQVIAERGPLTAAEAAQECARRWDGLPESYRKRALECVRAKAIEVAGVRECRVSGKRAMTYRTAAGRPF